MFKSTFLNFANRLIDKRMSLTPILVLFPTVGLIVTTSSVIIEHSIMHSYSKKD